MTETEKWINESLKNLPHLCAEIRRLSEENDALRAQQEAEKKAPLTLGELRKMEGEPVWVVVNTGIDQLSFWTLVEVCEESIFLTNNLGGRTEYAADVELEADCITVYRRNPEEA